MRNIRAKLKINLSGCDAKLYKFINRLYVVFTNKTVQFLLFIVFIECLSFHEMKREVNSIYGKNKSDVLKVAKIKQEISKILP